jgi:hypothetical protein
LSVKGRKTINYTNLVANSFNVIPLPMVLKFSDPKIRKINAENN